MLALITLPAMINPHLISRSLVNSETGRTGIGEYDFQPLFRLILLWVFLFSVAIVMADLPQPNVLIILADDQGWGDLNFQGNTNLKTPNIDSLAGQGVSFDRFFVCPLCAPTRAEFLTGRYHLRSNVFGVTQGKERMCLEEKTLADMFRSAGYSTAMFGKWHNGSQ